MCSCVVEELHTSLHGILHRFGSGEPISLPGNQANMARILTRLTLLLVGVDACTPCIIELVWGKNEEARHAVGGPRGDLSLIRRRILALSKIAINTVFIWTTDPELPILATYSNSFKHLPPTLQNLLLHTCDKCVYAREPVPAGTASAKLLTDNL
jgi:hypothetical protein